ncbi:MAG: hypothetical protein HXY30_02010 [Pseudorhodoplanes sp.]|nr:hypothetical protein [Pseudorhodoplanes sp.]
MKQLWVPAIAVLMSTAAATAQSAGPGGADGTPKPLLENAQIKVVEMRLKPGAKTEATQHPNSFVYSLTDGTLVFVPPGRTPYEMSFKAGEALWLPSQTTALANEGTKEIRALVVEIKDRAPVVRRAPKTKAASKPAKGESASAAKPAVKSGKDKP